MLTLKHFFDRPSWAAAAGYNFNIIDCMSEAANRIDVFKEIWGLICETPDIELRRIWVLPFNLAVCLLALLWPFIYPFFGLAMYFKCKRVARKYKKGMPDIVRNNLDGWLREFDREQRRKK